MTGEDKGFDWVKVLVTLVSGLLATIFAGLVMLLARTVITQTMDLRLEVHAVDKRLSNLETQQKRKTLREKAEDAARKATANMYRGPVSIKREPPDGDNTDLPE